MALYPKCSAAACEDRVSFLAFMTTESGLPPASRGDSLGRREKGFFPSMSQHRRQVTNLTLSRGLLTSNFWDMYGTFLLSTVTG